MTTLTDLKTTRENGFYTINGIRRPSVTKVTGTMGNKMGLKNWKRNTKNWRQIQRDSQIRGQFFHLRTLQEFSESVLEVPDYLNMCDWPETLEEDLTAMDEQWENLRQYMSLAAPYTIEYTLWYDGKFPYAGTLDGHCKVDNDLSMWDIKTSKRSNKDHEIQIGAYTLAGRQRGLNTERGYLFYVRPHEWEVVELDRSDLTDREATFMEWLGKFYRQKMTSK